MAKYNDTTVNQNQSDYQLSASDFSAAKPKSKAVDYYDPTGKQSKGYIIENKTYKDPEGKNRIDVGSKVQTGNQWWELTDKGGVKIDAPTFNTERTEVATPPVTKFDMQSMFTPEENQLYGIIDALTGALTQQQPTPTMSRGEATAMATAQLRQPFNQSLEETMKAYDESAIQRGMFGQMPTEALKREAMADVELSEQSAINNLANQLYQQDFEMGQAKDVSQTNLLSTKLAANRAQLADEAARRGEVQRIKDNEIMRKSAEEQSMIDNAYARWETLGYADNQVASALGIAEGTPSKDNMKLEVENQYKMALEEYKSLLALQEAAQKYGYDMSKIGYSSQSSINAALEKAQIDLWKAGQAADIDIATDLAKKQNASEIEKEYTKWENSQVDSDQKFDAFKYAIDMVSPDQDVKNAALDILVKKQTQEGGDFNELDVIKEMDAIFSNPNITEIMNTYNGLMNVMGGDTTGGINLGSDVYGGTYE